MDGIIRSIMNFITSATFFMLSTFGINTRTEQPKYEVIEIGRHVEHLQFFEVLLGDQPALSQSENAYQRLLAGDPVELTEQARIFLKEHTLATYYEQILVSALRRAWTDLQRGRLDQQQTQRIRNTVLEVVEDLESHRGSGKQSLEATPTAPPTSQTARRVLCLPGLGPLDEAVAILFAQLLRRRGIPTEAKKADLLATSKEFELETKDVGLICLCYLEHATKAQLQYTSRRLRRKAPAFPIVVGIFSETMPTGESDRSRFRKALCSCKAPCLLVSNMSPRCFCALGH
jgi:hypothetical protein